MELGVLKAIGDVLAMAAFFAITVWAFLPRNRKRFEQDGNLPFADTQTDLNKRDD